MSVSFEEASDSFASELEQLDSEAAVHAMVEKAVEIGSSDLFLLRAEHGVRFCVRHWGRMKMIAEISPNKGKHLLMAIKALSGMDISERRRPLDGRYVQEIGDRVIDLRINTIPTLHGEDVTMRILDREVGLRSLDSLGMNSRELDRLMSLLHAPSGLILVTGPTGAGKTTTLYACLQHLNDGERKINTLEDPIEYAVDGIRQSQVNAKLGIDFAQLLRSVMRQAPDVIMVGEIRDHETAATAVRAAHSGHLVFATLHSPVAAAAVQSMVTLGENSRFLASSILGVMAQRLVRTLCKECRIAHDLSLAPSTFHEIEYLLSDGEGQNFYAPGSCDNCSHEGYNGRTGLFEVMTFNRAMRELVADRRPSMEIHSAAVEAGMVEVRHSALLKVAQGETSMEEVLRAVPPEYLGLEG